MTLKRRSLISGGAALTAALGLTTTACSVPTGSPSGGGGGGTESQEPFRIAGSDPESMIPGNSYAFYLQTLMFDTLTSIDPETGEVVNLVASDVSPNEDLTQWTVTLHDNWTFHDGTPVTAQSYADAWNATAHASNAWENGHYLAEIVGYEKLSPSDGSEPSSESMSGLEILSDHEMRITLKGPNGLFPYTLANPAMGPLPEVAHADYQAFNEQPIGNGAFKIEGIYEPNADYHLVAYEGYAGTAPNVQAITFVPYTDYSTAFNDLLAGNMDAVYPVPAQRLGEMQSKLPGRFAPSTIPNLNYLALPTWNPQLEDVRVRKALSMAIDRQALVDSILQGSAEPAYSLAPDSAVGIVPDVCTSCTYDPEAAKRLLDEAGGVEGTLTLYATQYSNEDQVMQAIVNQLSQNLGIDVTLKMVDDSWQKLQDEELEGPTLAYWGAYFPHIQAMVQPLFTTGAPGNPSKYSNPEVDELVELGATQEGDEAVVTYQKAAELALADLRSIPLYYGVYTAAWGDRIATVPVGPNGYGDLGQIEPAS